jgi:hypothetical protein
MIFTVCQGVDLTEISVSTRTYQLTDVKIGLFDKVVVYKMDHLALRVVSFEDKKLSETLGFPASNHELLENYRWK